MMEPVSTVGALAAEVSGQCAMLQHLLVQHSVICLCVCLELAGGSAQVGLMLTSASLSFQH